MSQDSEFAVSTSTLSNVDLRAPLSNEVFYLEVIDAREVLEFVRGTQIDRNRSWIESHKFIFGFSGISSNWIRVAITHIRELISNVIIELSSCKQIPWPQNVNLSTWIDRIEILNSDPMNLGSRAFKSNFIEIAILALKQNEHCSL